MQNPRIYSIKQFHVDIMESVFGHNTVHDTKNGNSRVTVAVSITANGQVLKLFLVTMKGKNHFCIASIIFFHYFYHSSSNSCMNITGSSFNNFPDGASYHVQENAWMDEYLMLQWVVEILTPWAQDAPDGIIPFVFLDSYRCHMTDTVLKKCVMDDIGVEYVHIPGGCTGLCQPVDVGINKPLKDTMV